MPADPPLANGPHLSVLFCKCFDVFFVNTKLLQYFGVQRDMPSNPYKEGGEVMERVLGGGSTEAGSGGWGALVTG